MLPYGLECNRPEGFDMFDFIPAELLEPYLIQNFLRRSASPRGFNITFEGKRTSLYEVYHIQTCFRRLFIVVCISYYCHDCRLVRSYIVHLVQL